MVVKQEVPDQYDPWANYKPPIYGDGLRGEGGMVERLEWRMCRRETSMVTSEPLGHDKKFVCFLGVRRSSGSA